MTATLPILIVLVGCGAAGPPVEDEGMLTLNGRWTDENRTRLLEIIGTRGRRGASFDSAHPPVVLFDWDNTAMRGDIGDLAFAYALDHAALTGLPPAGGFGALVPLRPDLSADLDASCVPTAPGTFADHCRNLLSRIALTGLDLRDHDAFTVPISASYKPSYALLSQLFVGLTPEEVRSIGEVALRRALEAPLGARTEVAETEVEAFARISPELRELTEVLRREGFDLWVVSASHQALVEVAAAELGFAPDHVIGMRPRLGVDGRYAVGFEDPTEGRAGSAITTYDVGKRIWALREIFGLRDGLLEARSPRPVLAFGDADTDFAMLDWAEHALLFDRGHPRVTCRARERGWMVQPVLVAPPRVEPVSCP
jgi:phosphoserine phosphatase